MIKNTLLLLFIFTVLINNVLSQDIHWSQPSNLPLYQSNSNNGNFDEDIRFNAGAKEQWKSVTKPYQTLLISADTRLRKLSPIGIGILFLTDVTGDGSFRTNQSNLFLSYKLKFNNKLFLTYGIDFGFCNKQLDFTKFQFDSQYDGYKYNTNLSTNENYQNSSFFHSLIGTGLKLSLIDKNKIIEAGINLTNLNKPQETFYNIEVTRPIRTTAFLNYTIKLKNEDRITGIINYNNQLTYNELITGFNIQRRKKNIELNSIHYGILFRLKDAFIPMAGFEHNRIKLIFSYDINISKLSKASNGKGSLEITLQYLLKKRALLAPTKNRCIEYL